MNKPTLIIIDPQFDFCDPKGALSVPGADKDMERLAAMINKHVDDIDEINVTLDSHHKVHIAHAIWWVDSNGKHPDPFTLITADDVKTGKWRAMNPGFQKRSEAYVQALATAGRYVLCIWPEHCLIGTPGAAIVGVLNDALRKWEGRFDIANMVTKGSNPFTEHYSAVKADVEDPADATTKLNEKLVKILRDGNGDILIAGEALSHCVANTIRDIANEFTDEQVKRFVLLEDACSNVTGFEALGETFVKEMTARGMRISTTTTYFA
jgi:nicotinamidase-related amidase